MKDRYAVFGAPVLHSLSPRIFAAAFARAGLAACYTRVRPSDAMGIAPLAGQLRLAGANVTTPYKEAVMPFLRGVSAEARAIGGVNAIDFRGGTLGHNTDYLGAAALLTHALGRVAGRRVLVLGAGPAARAAAFGALQLGASVALANRHDDKAAIAAKQLGCKYIAAGQLPREAGGFHAIVSATLPCANLLDGVALPDGAALLDANYRPSRFTAEARAQGREAGGGERWLAEQARAAFAIFTGADPGPAPFLETLQAPGQHAPGPAAALGASLATPLSDLAEIDIIIDDRRPGDFERLLNEEMSATQNIDNQTATKP